MKFAIDKHDCSELHELIELAGTFYTDGDIINHAYLSWLYLQNPYGKPFLFVAREESENELAGQYLVVPVNFCLHGKLIKGTLSLHTLTKPKFQGNRLFTRMALATYRDCAENDALFTIGFPNPRSYHGCVHKLGFSHVGDVPFLIKPLRLISIVRSYLSSSQNRQIRDILPVANPVLKSGIVEVDLSSQTMQQKVDEYWKKIKHQYPVTTTKDAVYLKWRYMDIPTRDYYLFGVEHNAQLQGLIILRMAHVWGYQVGLVMDLTCLHENTGAGKNLLAFANTFFKQNNLDMVVALNTAVNPEYKIFRASGFFSIPQNFLPQRTPFIVRINKEFPGSGDLMELHNWKVTFGDYDVV